MKASDVRVGLIYRFRSLGDLFIVVKVLDDVCGAHEWLKLTGGDAGRTGTEKGLISTVAEGFWWNFQIPNFDSTEEQ